MRLIMYPSSDNINIVRPSVFINKHVSILATGELTENSNYEVSDYIRVLPNTTYTWQRYNTYVGASGFSTTTRLCEYKSDKVYTGNYAEITLTAAGKKSVTFTTSPNTMYIRFSRRISDEDVQIERGSTASIYKEYKGVLASRTDTDGRAKPVVAGENVIRMPNGINWLMVRQRYWTMGSAGKFSTSSLQPYIIAPEDNNHVGEIILDGYETAPYAGMRDKTVAVSRDGIVTIMDQRFASVDELEAAIGNNKILYRENGQLMDSSEPGAITLNMRGSGAATQVDDDGSLIVGLNVE